MATTSHDLPLASYPTRLYGPFTKATPNGFTGFKARIARWTSADPSIWPDTASRLKVMALCSYDGGNTFPHLSNIWDDIGGVKPDEKTGVEAPFTDAGFGCKPEPTHVQIIVEVINGPIRTSIDLTVP